MDPRSLPPSVRSLLRPLRKVERPIAAVYADIETSILKRSARRRAAELVRKGFTKVNCGCGNMILPGWINADIEAPPRKLFAGPSPERPNLMADLSKGLPFSDGVLTHVYSNNFLEHLKPFDGRRFLREAYRILVPGGTIRTVVPDVAQYVAAVTRHDIELLRRHTSDNACWPDWTATPMEYLVTIIQGSDELGWPHEWGYDEETLTLYLASEGFTDIRRYDVDESNDETFRDIDGTPAICLVLEATKPAG